MKLIFQKIINFFKSKKLKENEITIDFLNRSLISEREYSAQITYKVEEQRVMIECLSEKIEKMKAKSSASKKKAKKK